MAIVLILGGLTVLSFYLVQAGEFAFEGGESETALPAEPFGSEGRREYALEVPRGWGYLVVTYTVGLEPGAQASAILSTNQNPYAQTYTDQSAQGTCRFFFDTEHRRGRCQRHAETVVVFHCPRPGRYAFQADALVPDNQEFYETFQATAYQDLPEFVLGPRILLVESDGTSSVRELPGYYHPQEKLRDLLLGWTMLASGAAILVVRGVRRRRREANQKTRPNP